MSVQQPDPAPEPKTPAGSDAAPVGETASAGLDVAAREQLRERIVARLQTIYDPEIPVDIHELGLIYEIDVDEAGVARLQMTLTSPACPVAESLPPEVEMAVASIDGVTRSSVEIVWDPPWTPDRMSEAAKLQLNLL